MTLSPLLRPAGLLLAASLLPGFSFADSPPPSPQRRAELIHIVRQDCGSCHGLTLGGGLGPPLTPAALADKPAASLVATVVSGRPGTPMPPFRGIIDEAEAGWIVSQLISGFPKE